MATREPRRIASVWPEMPVMRGPAGAERLREWLPRARQIREANASRRQRVLAHEWARTRLRHLLDLERAEQWTGFVPPVHDSSGGFNDSPVRRALVELLRDVEQAEQGQPAGESAE